MPSFLQNVAGSLKSFWSSRSAAQQIMIAGFAVSVVVAFGLLIYWVGRPDYKVLYSNMASEDAARVVTLLQAQKVPYELTDGGTTIVVPADKVYDLRLSVAGEGVVHGQGLGFEIFDELKIGQTDFVQRINYQRALQGELSRTIAEFPQIDRARVHLSIPQKSLFVEDEAKPSASVVLMLKGKEKLEPKQLQAIVNLVSSSVDGLERGHITISDVTGQILYQPNPEDSLQGLSQAQFDYKLNMERSLEGRIEQMLAPVIGPGKVIARVNARIDSSQRTIHRETYDPSSAVVRSEQRSEENSNGRANIAGGSPDPNFRGDNGNESLSSQQSTRETRTTNFEINKEQQDIVQPVGDLERLTVAVIVDGTWATPEGAKEPEFTPRTPEEIARIQELIKNAVGFDDRRGDSIEVSSISFGSPDIFAEPSVLMMMMEYMQRLGKPFLNGLLIFLFLIMVVRPVVMTLIKPRVAEEEVEELISLPEAEERLALEQAMEDEVLDTGRRLELIKAQALQLSEQNMDQAVSVLRTWLKQEAV